jgi:hypothetical protein
VEHLDLLGGEDRVERGGDLRIPIPDQEAKPAEAVPDFDELAVRCGAESIPARCRIVQTVLAIL